MNTRQKTVYTRGYKRIQHATETQKGLAGPGYDDPASSNVFVQHRGALKRKSNLHSNVDIHRRSFAPQHTPIHKRRVAHRTMLAPVHTPATQTNQAVAETGVKKRKYRFKSGTVTLRDIKKLQTTTNLLVQKGPFRKIVKQITAEMGVKILYQKKAIEALQEAVEGYVIEKFKDANKHAKHAKRKTICIADLQMIQ